MRLTHKPYNLRQQQLGYLIGLFCAGTCCLSVKVNALRTTPTGVIKFAQTALKFLIPGRNRAQGDTADLIVFCVACLRGRLVVLYSLACPIPISPAQAKREIVCSVIFTYPLLFCAHTIALPFQCCVSTLIPNVSSSNLEAGYPNGDFCGFLQYP
jgi:hypothetical protein